MEFVHSNVDFALMTGVIELKLGSRYKFKDILHVFRRSHIRNNNDQSAFVTTGWLPGPGLIVGPIFLDVSCEIVDVDQAAIAAAIGCVYQSIHFIMQSCWFLKI